MIRKLLALLLATLLSAVASADHLVVRRAATIKATPESAGAVLVRPAIDAVLLLLDDGTQSNGYYHVRVPDLGTTGWIYRTLARRFPGDPPGIGPGVLGLEDQGVVDVYWWNIRDLSSGSRDDAELARIAEALRGAEVVAVGELNDVPVLARLATQLGPTWRHDASPKVGDSPNSAEHYGFLWDTAVLAMVGSVRVDTASEDQIDREPAWATFRTNNGNLDFTVIAIHVKWGTLVEQRRAEIRRLPEVWNRVQAATLEDDDLILVGDFNRNVGDESFDGLLTIAGMVRANEESPPTHISSTSTYDQVFLGTGHTTEWLGTFTVHRFDEALFGDDDTAASLACSDHRPVSVPLRVPGGDDDG